MTPPTPEFYLYDIETYPNFFLIVIKCVGDGKVWRFEISDRRNDTEKILTLITHISTIGGHMVGYNNVGFDYPVLHLLLTNPSATALDLYNKGQEIITSRDDFAHTIWEDRCIVRQIDLMKIHHYDNKGVSLKMLEYVYGMESIQDLPYAPGSTLTEEQMDHVTSYCDHDIDATEECYRKSAKQIAFRFKLQAETGMKCLNYNDTKIGEQYLVQRLEEHTPGVCYSRDSGSKRPRQTMRPVLHLRDAVFDYIQFEQPEFTRIRDYFVSQSIRETKGVFNGLVAKVQGFKYVFSVGGVHGSIPSGIVYSDANATLVDLDVASYYPNLAIANRVYPEHLGVEFCAIYREIYEQRKGYGKGTVENLMLKLALNGAYGKSNSVYSPFYDPLFTMKTTLNGQLLLCVLAEQLIKIPGLDMIQVNTDGLTVKCPNDHLAHLFQVKQWWEEFTHLELEHAIYRRMLIRDVNSYIAENAEYKEEKDRYKRKGAYEYERLPNQNLSQLVVPRVACEVLLNGGNIRELVTNHPTTTDFFLRTKLKRSDRLTGSGEPLQRITRYYVSRDGVELIKTAPPVKGAREGLWKRGAGVSNADWSRITKELSHRDQPCERDDAGMPHDPRIHTKNKSKHETRRTQLCAGRLATVCNDTLEIDRNNIDFDYYVDEVEKIVFPLLRS